MGEKFRLWHRLAGTTPSTNLTANVTRVEELAVEIFNSFSNLETGQLQELFRSQNGYATPRVDVRAAVFRDHRLLMVRERSDGGLDFTRRLGGRRGFAI